MNGTWVMEIKLQNFITGIIYRCLSFPFISEEIEGLRDLATHSQAASDAALRYGP